LIKIDVALTTEILTYQEPWGSVSIGDYAPIEILRFSFSLTSPVCRIAACSHG